MRSAPLWPIVCLVLTVGCGRKAPPPPADEFVGSARCRSCHQSFYEKWAPSFHGLAMRPYTTEFARRELRPQTGETTIAGRRYQAEIAGNRGFVRERGPDGETRFEIVDVLGGKNVFYFLTRLDRGRLQVLPLAYDVRNKEWYDTAASGIRHFPGHDTDAPFHWTDRQYTFNTSCYSCHVSQLQTNYDPESDSYRSLWAEPGINCETCHGPSGGHLRVFQAQAEESGQPGESRPPDLHIILTNAFTPAQTNSLCAPCHAKMIPLTTRFRPGDRYFDHFDLVTLDNPDFYPDGRDLGENYTYSSWMMSPCVRSGHLDCMQCHTSSGRYRFAGEHANDACLPCHEDKVKDLSVHTHHAAGSAGSECIACHMPMTEFARMRRTDHSMLPPTPATAIRYQSPNACNLCHSDKDPAWADRQVRTWYKRDYQAPVLARAALIDAARKRDWSRLDDMLAYIRSKDHDEVTAAALIRLLHGADDESVGPALIAALADPSPLVRSSAAAGLGTHLDPAAIRALARAAADGHRVVRIRAAASLASVPEGMLEAGEKPKVTAALAEFERSMRSRPDDAASNTSLGNYYVNRGDLERALQSYQTATRLQPDWVPALVNSAMAYNALGRNDQAEQQLRTALQYEPANAAAQFNLGLLLGEVGRPLEAKGALRAALKAEPSMAAAAYNLCVLEAQDDVRNAIPYCRQAAQARTGEPKYTYTLAFFLNRAGDSAAAALVLRDLLRQHPDYNDARGLLARIGAVAVARGSAPDR